MGKISSPGKVGSEALEGVFCHGRKNVVCCSPASRQADGGTLQRVRHRSQDRLQAELRMFVLDGVVLDVAAYQGTLETSGAAEFVRTLAQSTPLPHSIVVVLVLSRVVVGA